MKRVKYIMATILALFVVQIAQSASAAPPKNKAIIVLDASGSMLYKLDGKRKINIARGVIDRLLKDWDSNTELGITAYGHREKGNCADIETVVPVGKVNRNKIMSAINRLRPQGRTPLSAAVLMAANELKYTKDKATVILVSDGGETCNADPCKLAKELEKSGVDFTVHVVGLDLEDRVKAKLRCLATNTGGQFLQAKNATELNEAMKKTVKIVTKQKPATEQNSAVTVVAGETGIELHTVYAKGADPVKSRVEYYIYEAKKDVEGKRKKVTYEFMYPSIKKAVPAGRYYVTASYGNAFASQEVEVKANQLSKVTLVLNAGVLTLNASFAKGGDPVTSRVEYYVYEAKKDVEGKRKKVTYEFMYPSIKKTVPAGRYYVTANYGEASASGEVEVKANESTEKTLVLNAGVLNLNASFTKGGNPLDVNVKYSIYDVKKDIEGNRKRITYDTSPSIERVLPAGNYYIEAMYEKVSANKEVNIKPGEQTKETMVIPKK